MQIKKGYEVIVLKDAIRAVQLHVGNEEEEAIKMMQECGADIHLPAPQFKINN